MKSALVPDTFPNMTSQPASNQDERRAHPRLEYRTTGLALTCPAAQSDEPPRAVRVWTENFGLSGVLIVSQEQIPGDQVLLKLMLPQLGDTIVECDIVHREHREAGHLAGGFVTHAFGLKFRRRLAVSDLSQHIRALLTQQTADLPAPSIAVPAETTACEVSKGTALEAASIDFLMSKLGWMTSPSQLRTSRSGAHPSETESLVPTLSAIGLVVVYASLGF